MTAHTITLSLPPDVISLLGPVPAQAAQSLTEFAVLGLYQEGRLSTGKAAELLGLTYRGFVALLARKGIDYFRFDQQAWDDEVQTVMAWKERHG